MSAPLDFGIDTRTGMAARRLNKRGLSGPKPQGAVASMPRVRGPVRRGIVKQTGPVVKPPAVGRPLRASNSRVSTVGIGTVGGPKVNRI